MSWIVLLWGVLQCLQHLQWSPKAVGYLLVDWSPHHHQQDLSRISFSRYSAKVCAGSPTDFQKPSMSLELHWLLSGLPWLKQAGNDFVKQFCIATILDWTCFAHTECLKWVTNHDFWVATNTFCTAFRSATVKYYIFKAPYSKWLIAVCCT